MPCDEAPLRVIHYEPSMREAWDEAVDRSKNATFLLKRAYMEYHADRFTDHSLLLMRGDSIETLLPATRSGSTLNSHGGLTYGGFVMSNASSGVRPLAWINAIKEHMRSEGLTELIYKPVPHIYHTQPAEEDLYALWRAGAQPCIRNLSTAIRLDPPMIPSSKRDSAALKRKRRYGIEVAETQRVADFWPIIEHDRAYRHNTRPVHTADELQGLRDSFPDNIRLFSALISGEVVAGAVVYLDGGVIHLQYAAATPDAMKLHAVDVIYNELIHNTLTGYRWFDFGISNEDAGRYLNEGMVRHKEEFGGRSVMYDTYKLTL